MIIYFFQSSHRFHFEMFLPKQNKEIRIMKYVKPRLRRGAGIVFAGQWGCYDGNWISNDDECRHGKRY